jgi:hypothetical protein
MAQIPKRGLKPFTEEPFLSASRETTHPLSSWERPQLGCHDDIGATLAARRDNNLEFRPRGVTPRVSLRLEGTLQPGTFG